MRSAIALVLFASLQVVSGQSQSPPPSRDKARAQDTEKPEPKSTAPDSVVVVQQETAKTQDDGAKNTSKSYFARLIAPENLPNLILCLVGIGGIIIAICTLKIIERQTKATEEAAKAAKDSADALVNSERAWVIVEEAHLIHVVDIGVSNRFVARPTIKNLGKTIARIRKVSLGGDIVRRNEKLGVSPTYSEVRDFDFVLCPEQEFPPNEVVVFPITGERVADVNTYLFTLYVYGLVEYLDLAGKERTTAFVLVYDPPGFLPHLGAPAAYYKTS